MPNNTHEIENRINSFYEMLSGKKEKIRDWNSFRSLFSSKALLSIRRKDIASVNSYTIEEYIQRLESVLQVKDFFEFSKSNTHEITGNICMVHNTYEAYEDGGKTSFIKDGNNFILLAHDGKSWKIASMLWEDRKS